MSIREAMADWSDDLRHALRRARREPTLLVAVVVTLGIAIAANASTFAIVDRLLLRGPSHVSDPERVMRVYMTIPGPTMSTGSTAAFVTYTDMRERTSAFAEVAAYTSVSDLPIGNEPDAARVAVRHATWTIFPLLGVRPHLGRFFGEAEDRPPAGEPVVVLDHGLWVTHFGGDPGVLGRSIVLDGRRYTVVGVAPQGFTGPELARVDAWIPMSARVPQPMPDWPTTRQAKWLHVIARLAPGVSLEEAGAQATAAHRGSYTGTWKEEGQATLSLRPLHYNRSGTEPVEASVSRWLLGIAVVVLLVACANIANLLLARVIRRKRELAVRLALGSNRARLTRMLVFETLVLVIPGAMLGLLLTAFASRIVRTRLLPEVVWDTPPVDARALAFTALLTVVSALLVSLVPALRATRQADLTNDLKAGSRQAGHRTRAASTLTLAQAALSMLLLVGAGLFLRSAWQVRDLDLGIEPDRVLVASLAWPSMGSLAPDAMTRERARRASIRTQAMERLRSLPGVAGSALAVGTPFQSAYSLPLSVPGIDSIPQLPGGGPYVMAVSSGYFETVGTSVERGRPFTDDDDAAGERVVIVSRTMARTLWPNADPLTKCLRVGGDTMPCARVVGIAEDTHRFALREPPAMQYYVPLPQSRLSGPDLLVRPRGEPTAQVSAIRQAIIQLDPTLRFVDLQSLERTVAPQARPWRLAAVVFGTFAAIALVMAAIGLYSVTAYAVAQRGHEMGVRLAMGARPADVFSLILRGGVGVGAAGVAIGTVAAIALSPSVEPLLFSVSSRDPAVYLSVAAALLLSAVVACLVPARRAMRVDPVVALRAE